MRPERIKQKAVPPLGRSFHADVCRFQMSADRIDCRNCRSRKRADRRWRPAGCSPRPPPAPFCAYASIPEDHDLILDSDRDRPIDDDGVVRLKPTGVERIASVSAPKVEIFVNAREHLFPKGRLTFWDIVRLAFPSAQPQENTAYTVSYRKGPGDRPEGTLISGESVRVKKGMLFNVSETNKS